MKIDKLTKALKKHKPTPCEWYVCPLLTSCKRLRQACTTYRRYVSKNKLECPDIDTNPPSSKIYNEIFPGPDN